MINLKANSDSYGAKATEYDLRSPNDKLENYHKLENIYIIVTWFFMCV